MSKSLKKLIDINRLREFKNKLVGTDSAYVQTAAVDQTIAGTKTFSKPIAGSVTGSSGSCTGNAATATTAGAVSTSVAAGSTKDLVYATMADNDYCRISCSGSSDAGYLEIATGDNGNDPIYVRQNDNRHGSVRTLTLLDGSGNTQFPGTVSASTFSGNLTGNCSGSSGSCTGNAATATKLAAKRTIALSGAATGTATGFDGSGNITIPVTSLDASKLTGTASVSTTGNAATATTATTAESCTGNAATATKLATARTIALSGAATGTATGFDGSGNITIPVTALAASAIRAQWYAAYPDGAEAHNAMWGGRDITSAFDDGTFSTNVANGTFRDIFPGDYITKQVTISGTAYTVNWVVADCDYWWHKGDQHPGMETHHVVIVPQVPIFRANMNATNTAEGGYAGSAMYRETIPACATGIVNTFGADHILTFRDLLTQDLNTSAVSSGITTFTGAPNWNGTWASVQCNLMSEAMVYNGPHCASSAADNIMATRQMSAFRLSERLINYNRRHWWLRDVVSSAFFAIVLGDGQANTAYASNVNGVRPFALLR